MNSQDAIQTSTNSLTANNSKERVKPVETLVLATKAEQKRAGHEIGSGRKEDERITSAVMKVLEGYDWNLVQASAKWVILKWRLGILNFSILFINVKD